METHFNTHMPQYYTYQLVDPRTNKPFYVGKGVGTRALEHKKEAKFSLQKQTNILKCQKINEIIAAGLDVIVNYVGSNLTEIDAYALEIRLIKQYGKIIDGTGILTNIRDGGKDGLGKRRRNIVQYTIDGKKVRTFQFIIEAARTLQVKKGTIMAALQGRITFAGGYRWSYADKSLLPVLKRKRIAVTQFSLEGVPLKDFASIEEAGKINGIRPELIAQCVHKNFNSCHGFRWALKGLLPSKLKRKKFLPGTVKYGCFSKAGKLIQTFDTLPKAASWANLHKSSVYGCCTKKVQQVGGYVWRFIDATTLLPIS